MPKLFVSAIIQNLEMLDFVAAKLIWLQFFREYMYTLN